MISCGIHAPPPEIRLVDVIGSRSNMAQVSRLVEIYLRVVVKKSFIDWSLLGHFEEQFGA